MCANIVLEVTAIPVSYTHLDVYKRQVTILSIMTSIGTPCVSFSGLGELTVSAAKMTISSSVSYTHLWIDALFHQGNPFFCVCGVLAFSGDSGLKPLNLFVQFSLFALVLPGQHREVVFRDTSANKSFKSASLML